MGPVTSDEAMFLDLMAPMVVTTSSSRVGNEGYRWSWALQDMLPQALPVEIPSGDTRGPHSPCLYCSRAEDYIAPHSSGTRQGQRAAIFNSPEGPVL